MYPQTERDAGDLDHDGDTVPGSQKAISVDNMVRDWRRQGLKNFFRFSLW